jgi:hypothetical protein
MSRIKIGLSLITSVVVLAACQQKVADSGPGFSLKKPPVFEAVPQGVPQAVQTASLVPDQPVISGEVSPSAPLNPIILASIPAAESAQSPAQKPIEVASAASVGAPLAVTEFLSAENTTISDEQDFGAVSVRETIQSDAERLESQRASYTVIQPTDLPTRPETVNVAQYALAATNPVGTKRFTRINPFAKVQNVKNCGRYLNQDDAQAAFLDAGGPRRDIYSLDPDGDGYACKWTPETYRKLLSSN